MGRYKSLALNTVIFGICSFTSKLLTFLMLPLYTEVLSKEEFGTADLVTTIVGLLTPVLSLSISQGVMRFALDKSKNIKEVFTFGLKVTMGGILLLFICYPIITRIPILCDYIWSFLLLYVTQVLHSLIGLFARGLNKVKLVGTAGVISSFVVVGSNVLFLFVFHYGVAGYLLSIIISNVIFISFLFITCKMYRYIGRGNNIALNKEMLSYSIPMIPNSLSWWIQHSANRYIINYYCGVGNVGLYSAASKMPTIVDTFRGIFVQAWQLSTITELDKEGSEVFFKNIYKLFNVFIIILCSGMLVLCKFIANILYSDDFYEAWTLTPLLTVGILFSSLVAFYSPMYLAHKKTNKLFFSTACGAVITIVSNFILVPRVGVMGAAVSVVVSNFAIFLYLHVDTKKYLPFTLSDWRFFISYAVIFIHGNIITFFNCSPTGPLSLLLSLIILFLNWNDITYLLSELIKKFKKKRI